jgi:hypothetical protein
MKKLKTCSACQEEKVIWKNHEGNKYCQYCWNKLKSGEPEFKSMMPKVSDKRAKKDAEYLKLRYKFLTENSMCKISVAGCSTKATDVHHTYAGANRDAFYLVQSTWLPVCRNCHDFVHLNPEDARVMGWLK